MSTPRTVQSWKPEDLETIADTLARQRSTLVTLSTDLERGKPPEGWESAEVEPARAAHRRLEDSLASQTAELATVISALDTAAADITAAQSALGAATSRAYGHRFQVNLDTGSVSIDALPINPTSQEQAIQVMEEVRDDIAKAVADADLADATLADVLRHAANTDVQNAPSLEVQFASLPVDDQVDYLLTHPDEAEDYLPHLSDEAKTAIGAELADRLDDLMEDGNAVADNDPRVNKMTGLLETFGGDPVVAARLFDELGAGHTARNFWWLSEMNKLTDGTTGDDDRTALAVALRASLAAATTAPGFDDAEFGRDLVIELTEFQDPPSGHALPDAAVLQFILEGTGYSQDFVVGAADRLDYFDRVLRPHNDMPFFYNWQSSNSGPSLPLSSGPNVDPMGAVMDQFVEHPDVGREFFAGGSVGVDRARYYFAQRDWVTDGFESVSAAVESIVTDPDNNKDFGAETSLLASQFFDWVTDNDGFSPNTAWGASEHVSAILAHYMPVVDEAVTSPTSSGEPGLMSKSLEFSYYGTFENAPSLFADDLKELMQVALVSDEGLSNMAVQMGAYTQHQVNNFAQARADGTPTNLMQLEDIVSRGARLQGFAQWAVGDLDIGDAAAADARASGFTELAASAASLVPLPGAGTLGSLGSKVVSFGYAQLVDSTSELADEAFASQTEATLADWEDRARFAQSANQYNVFSAMVNAGLVEPVPEWLDASGKPKPFAEVLAADGGNYSGVDNGSGKRLVDLGVSRDAINQAYRGVFDPTYFKEWGRVK